MFRSRGGFRGGGGGGRSSPQGFDPLPTQRVPLWYFLRNSFWPTDPIIFLKAPLAPIYTNYEGERAPKKNACFFLSKFFKKCPKTAFLTVFSKICLRRRKFSQNRGKTVLWESTKNQFVRPKKKVVKIFEFFLKITPPPPPPPSRKSLIRPCSFSNTMQKWDSIIFSNLCSVRFSFSHNLTF